MTLISALLLAQIDAVRSLEKLGNRGRSSVVHGIGRMQVVQPQVLVDCIIAACIFGVPSRCATIQD